MSNNQEQLHTASSKSKNLFPDEFEMQWGTDDLPEGMKRKGSTHHRSHTGSSHHSSHHRSSHSYYRTSSGGRRHSSGSTGDGKSTFQDLLFADSSAGKTSSRDSTEKNVESKWTNRENAAKDFLRNLKEDLRKKEPVSEKTVEEPEEDIRHEIVSDPLHSETDLKPEDSSTIPDSYHADAVPESLETAADVDVEKPNSEELPDENKYQTPAVEDPAERKEPDIEIGESQPTAESQSEDEDTLEKTDKPSDDKKSGSEPFKKNPLKQNRTERKGTRKPWSRKKKIGVSVLCVLLAIILGGLGFVNGMLNKIGKEQSDILPKADPDKRYEDIDKTDKYGVGDISLKPIKQDKVKNILLIGQDRRKGDGARMRSDSMIVATIDLTTNEIKLTSLMRDMYIPVPGYGYGMINATYLNGGMALLNETIEQNFGITIDGNVEVDFDRFIKLMNLVGPIEIDLNKDEVEYLNRGNGWNLKVGTNTMTSEQVLAYARTRYVGRSDWERTDRQRSVLTKIFNKLRRSDLTTLYRFANAAFPLFKTDLTNTEILRYVYTVMSKRMTISQSKRIPVDGTYTQEVKEETLNVLVPRLEPNAQALQKFVYGYSNVEVKDNEKRQEAKQTAKKKKSSSLVIDE